MDFGRVPNGKPLAEAPGTRYDPTLNIFEPRDAIKGDIARILFYMDVRYEGDQTKEPDLRLVEALPRDLRRGVDRNGNGYFSNISTLLKWHEQDPVDEMERRRQDRVFEIQGNRNPFIDHPEWVGPVFQPDAGR